MRATATSDAVARFKISVPFVPSKRCSHDTKAITPRVVREIHAMHLVFGRFALVLAVAFVGQSPRGALAATDSQSLLVTLRSTSTVDAVQIADFNYAANAQSAPLLALRQHPPLAANLADLARATGAVATRLAQEPDSLDARLQRQVVLFYPDSTHRDAARSALLVESSVEAVELQLLMSPADTSTGPPGLALLPVPIEQPHLAMMNLRDAWASASGWGLVVALDNGLYPDHAALHSLTGSASETGTLVPGGNYLPYFSRNVGGRGQPVDNLDETQSNVFVGPNESACDPDGDGRLIHNAAGHGTHVSGLIGANPAASVGVAGSCRNCGVGMIKFTSLFCRVSLDPPAVGIYLNLNGLGLALAHAQRSGAQVINMSLGQPNAACGDFGTKTLCEAITLARPTMYCW